MAAPLPVPPPAGGALTGMLNAFLMTFSLGYGQTVGDALTLLKLLATLEIIVLGVYWMISEDHIAGVLLTKLLLFGVLLWLLTEWPALMKAFMNSFIQWGITAGAGRGAVVKVWDFQSPGNIFAWGADLAVLLIEYAKSIKGWNVLFQAVDIGFAGVLALGILVAFGVLAIQIAVAILEFYLKATLAILTLPLGAFHKFAAYTERTIAGVIAQGVKLTCLAFIVTAAQPALVFLTLTKEPTIDQMISIGLGVAFLWYLAWQAPAFAQSFLAGVSLFSAGSVMRSAVSASALVGAGAAGVAGGIGTGARSIAGADRGVQATVGAARAGGVRGVASLAASSGATLARNTDARVMTWGRGGGGGRAILTAQRMIPHD